MKIYNVYVIKHFSVLLLTMTFCTLATAGALLTDPSEPNIPAPKKQTEPMGTAVTGADNVTPILKEPHLPQKFSCWQNGELILEQAVIAPRGKVNDLRLLQSPFRGVDMLAFDFKNAFCFIK